MTHFEERWDEFWKSLRINVMVSRKGPGGVLQMQRLVQTDPNNVPEEYIYVDFEPRDVYLTDGVRSLLQMVGSNTGIIADPDFSLVSGDLSQLFVFAESQEDMMPRHVLTYLDSIFEMS